MTRWLTATREAGDVLSGSESRQLTEEAQRHLLHAQRAMISYTPKHHMFMELSLQSGRHGNPKLLACWSDESLNQRLRDLAARAHSARQEERVFMWMSLLGGLGIDELVFGMAPPGV